MANLREILEEYNIEKLEVFNTKKGEEEFKNHLLTLMETNTTEIELHVVPDFENKRAYLLLGGEEEEIPSIKLTYNLEKDFLLPPEMEKVNKKIIYTLLYKQLKLDLYEYVNKFNLDYKEELELNIFDKPDKIIFTKEFFKEYKRYLEQQIKEELEQKKDKNLKMGL